MLQTPTPPIETGKRHVPRGHVSGPEGANQSARADGATPSDDPAVQPEDVRVLLPAVSGKPSGQQPAKTVF